LELQGSLLRKIHGAGRTDEWLINKPSVPLAQVLHRRRLTTKMKMSLAYTLARSVWRYYDSDWMKSEWTCKTIHLMLQSSASLKYHFVDASKPCSTVRFQATKDTIPMRYDIPELVHEYPRVVALGLLLINIALTSYEEGVTTVAQTQQQKANADWMTGWSILEQDKSWPDLGTADAARQRLRTVYRTATQSCFEPEIFREVRRSSGSTGGAKEAQRHRKILYERVVRPLKDIIADMGWTDSLDEFDPIEFDDADTASIRKGPLQLPRQVNSAYCNAKLFDDEMPLDGHTSDR